MNIETLKTKGPTMAIVVAYHTAANVVAVLSGAEADSLAWPTVGTASLAVDKRASVQEVLAGFVRENPTAPAEALYRFANGRGFHSADVDNFASAELLYRAAYEVFFASLLTFDDLVKAEIARLEVLAQAETIIPAAALAEKPEDTILEQLPDPLELTPGVALVQAETPAGFRAPTPAPVVAIVEGPETAAALQAQAPETPVVVAPIGGPDAVWIKGPTVEAAPIAELAAGAPTPAAESAKNSDQG